ncbi:PRAME family member 12-like [Octodon degus]|uniref:Leucine-rich repeat-containing protein 14 n=1 Tax=Octodon degus TaxID=10160 RepID=A0A6P6DV90_OCTDE|nr:PRAME family member 12-like [Octodon degus]
MSTQSPCTLVQLAVQNLLRDKVLTVEAVEDLPGELFPLVFMEAFARGHTEVLKAMVLSWPFPSLPLRALMRMRKLETSQIQLDVVHMDKRNLETFQAVLDALDEILTQKVYNRRLKLQVLDMRIMHQNFWNVWTGNHLETSSSGSRKRRKTEKSEQKVAEKKQVTIILDLWIRQSHLGLFQSYLLKWVQERKGFVKLSCSKLHIKDSYSQTTTEILEMLNLGSVQEVDVGQCWKLHTLACFAPYLGQMQNLQKITLSDISEPSFISTERREQLVTQITSQFLKLHCLQEVYMDSVSFLEGKLDQMLRCLVFPLETFSLTHCKLSQTDWNQLPQNAHLRQLKHLDLSGTSLTDFNPEPLRVLLDNVATTLTTLHLESCRITDNQLCAILPSLSRCTQLTTFCFIKNSISTGAMKNLLCHTAGLSNLNLELYSVPQDVYVPRHNVHQQRQIQASEALRIVNQLNYPRIRVHESQ